MKFAIRNVIREDGVIGTMVISKDMNTVAFTPARADDPVPRVVPRDPYDDYKTTMYIRHENLVQGISDEDKKEIFG